MRVSFSLVVVVAALGCGAGSCAAGSSLDDEQVDEFVAAHNVVRAEATDPAPDPALPPLTFDADLARTAQEWSARCVFEHSTNGLGENIAAFSGADSSPDDVVDAWASEDEFFDFDSNTCAEGQQCGHYTQIVWRDTQRMGCGVSSCNFPELGGEGLFWVCNYDPPGNFNGTRPY